MPKWAQKSGTMGKKLQSKKRARLVMRFYEGVRFRGVFYLVEVL